MAHRANLAKFRVIAYVTEKADPEKIRYAKLTHINYAFLIPRLDGSLRKLRHPEKLTRIVHDAHQHGVKVLISVGGWGWDKQFEALAADKVKRDRCVSELVHFAAENDLDGVDMDWEYPDPGESAQNFLVLMKALRSRLPGGKLLTAAVVALGDYYGKGVPAESFALMDFVNVMAYDGQGSHHSPFQYARDSLDYWLGRGVPQEKLVLGVPFYARPTGASYSRIVQFAPEAAQQDVFVHHDRELNYNGIPTIQAKTRLAMERGSGIMFWTLEHDTEGDLSLLEAICRSAGKQSR